MAVDTREKRASVLGIGLAALVVLPTPDASVDNADRVQITYSYAGSDFTGVAGSGDGELNALTSSGTGAFGPSGTGDSELNAFTSSATGAVEVTGTGDGALNGFTSSGTGSGGEVVENTGGWLRDPYAISDRARRRRGAPTEEEEEQARRAAEAKRVGEPPEVQPPPQPAPKKRAGLKTLQKRGEERLDAEEQARLIEYLEQQEQRISARKKLAAVLLIV